MKFAGVTMAALSLLLLVIFGQVQAADTKAVKEISAKEAAELINKGGDNLLILDVRTPAEFAEGHIANAKNMDFFGGRFDTEILSLPKDKTILLYCRSGKRSAGAAEDLAREGFTNIMHMDSGMEEWEKEGLPVDKSAPKPGN